MPKKKLKYFVYSTLGPEKSALPLLSLHTNLVRAQIHDSLFYSVCLVSRSFVSGRTDAKAL